MEQGQRIAERLEPVDPIELPDLVRKHGKVQLRRQVAPRVYAKRGRPRHGSCWERHARQAHREEDGPCHRERVRTQVKRARCGTQVKGARCEGARADVRSSVSTIGIG